MMKRLKQILRPKVVIPVLLSIAVLAVLLFFGNVKHVIHVVEAFNRLYMVWFVILMVVYEVVRGVQWNFLLESMGIRAPLRAQIFAFALGEVTKSVPIGNYFQNFVLQQAKGTDFAVSSAATSLVVLIEVFVSLMGVAIIGLGSWSGWLRPVILIGLPVFGFSAWAVQTWQADSQAPRWVKEHKLLRKAIAEIKRYRESLATLFHPRIIGIAALLGAAYVIVAASALYLVVRGLGIGSVSLWQVWAVYFFSLGFSLIVPLPMDIGPAELSAVGAFLAVGLSKGDAVGAMLVNRALGLGTAAALAIVAMIVLRDQLRAALQSRQSSASSQRAQASKEASQAADRV